MSADGQLAGTPSFVFDAVAVVLSAEAGKSLAKDSAAIDFVSNAWVHLKTIASGAGEQPLLKAGNVGKDAGIVDVADAKGFVTTAKTRQWARSRNCGFWPDVFSLAASRLFRCRALRLPLFNLAT